MTASLLTKDTLRASTRPALRSAIYEGSVTHRRFGPGPAREFTYPVAMPLVWLDEIDSLKVLRPLFSERRPAPVRLRRSDFFGDKQVPLDEAVLGLVEERLGSRPAGPVAILANLRTWGWLFNPITLYFCAPGEGRAVEALVAEVENTPWHERHAYVVGPPGRHRFAKVMHVSPFMPMGLGYELVYTTPGERLAVRLDVMSGAERLMGVTMSLRRRPLDRRALARMLWRHPAATHRVSAGIYVQAARLGLKRAPFYVHPERRVPEP